MSRGSADGDVPSGRESSAAVPDPDERKRTRPNDVDEVLTYGRPTLEADDRAAVMGVLAGHWLTQGPVVDEFERALSEAFGVRHAVVASNGTAALHLAALCLGWEPGDVVVVPAITFLASANCAVYVGAEPYFVDIDETTLTVDPGEVERAVKHLRGAGKRVRAVVGVDMAGNPCDWTALREIADRYDLQLVDDACHAIGATYDGGTKVGSCAHADVSVLSFHAVKHVTTGEGGALLTNDAAVAKRARRLRSHGTVRGPDGVAGWEGPWHYDMVELGYNYRLTDLQCSLGLSQLAKLDRFVERRRRLAAYYDHLLVDSPGIARPNERPGARHAYHLYVARIDFEQARFTKRRFFAECEQRGILLQVHYRPVPLNSYYARREMNLGVLERIPASLRYYAEAVSLPMYPELRESQVERVVDTITALARE